ncbi:MAG: metallophosphoesterase [Verrucomicrobiaceae bacterium]|nr:metallophosphoesterase [Verrucomicrobiaceae bacterium]
MPLTLPATVSRRQFLQQAGLATFSAALGAHAQAANRSELWYLLSDTHIDADSSKTNKDNNMAANLDQVVAAIKKAQEAERTFGLIINGDLAFNDGQPGDYNTFVAHVQPLRDAGIDVHVTMGNHDDRENFKKGCMDLLHLRKSPLDHHHCGILTSAIVNWVLLDSLETVDQTPGLLGDAQLGWLDRTLRDLPNKPTLIVSHHDLQGPLVEGKKATGLKDTEALIKVIEQHSKVQAYIHGHTHRWEVKTRNSGLHVINVPAIGYAHNPVQPTGYLTARVTDKGISIQLQALDSKHSAHLQKHDLEWS